MSTPAAFTRDTANLGGAMSNTRWRSATEHDVYADNHDEDIFGWIQPDEWDTVAGPNKNNFLRGDCVECATDQSKPTVPPTLHSCGAPSCGYGAQCCEYSRRATHTNAPSELPPALLLQHANKPPGPSKIAHIAKVEQKSSLGVSLIDIIHGRSCRPISLLDLRTFLHFQREPHKRLTSYYPASDMQSSAIDHFDLNLDLSTTSSPSPHLVSESKLAQPIHYDEVDALDFLIAYVRYLTKFRDQTRAHRLKSPDPATCKAAVRAYVRRKCKARVSSDLTAIDVLLQGDVVVDDHPEIPEQVSRDVLARLKPADLGLRPETQPLRVEFDRMVHRYLCSRRVCVLPATRKRGRKRDSGSSSDTVADAADTLTRHLRSSSNVKLPRLRWMVDVGLISETDLQLSLAECDFSTHPDVLAPIAEAVYVYLSQHVVPFFFISVARNLSPNTKRGRLLVGIVCTLVALAFSVMLILTPSPLAPHANNGTGEILRWWRLLTAPIWCAGIGYILAYFTGLCVWLTLRGNREPDEEEEREREEIRSRISGEDVVGFDLAELQAAVDERDLDAEQDTNRWMAPELAAILSGITGQKKDKQTRQRSTSDVLGLRHLEEGRTHSRSEITDVAWFAKVSLEQTPVLEKLAEASNATSSPSGLAARSLIEKDVALTMPAAVILHTSRRRSVMMGASEAAGRASATLSALDFNTANSARPSLDRAGSSMNDLCQADTVVASGNSPSAPALMRHRRVPLLNFSIGIVSASGNELAEEHVDAPVLTRDALLFDPGLAARVASASSATSPLGASTGRGASSPHSSPPPGIRHKSLAHALLPLKPSGRMPTQLHDEELSSPTRERSGESDEEEKEGPALPTVPGPLHPREIAPWSTPSSASADPASFARPLLFSLPASRKSRLSATTSTTVVGSSAAVPSAPKRSYEGSTLISFKERLWAAVQRGTGFAVRTERVLDARVRRAQQMKALRIMALNTLATVVVVAVVVVIP